MANPNIASHLSDMAAQQPRQMAIACPRKGGLFSSDGFTELSFEKLDNWSDDIAQGLIQYGIRKGTRVVLLVPPGPEFFALVFGLMKAGAVMVCIDPGIGIKAMGQCIDHSKPTVFIGSSKAHIARRVFSWGRASTQLNITTAANLLLFANDKGKKCTLNDVTRRGQQSQRRALPQVVESDLAAILFTSGSTGAPKGVMYSHATFQAQIHVLRASYDITPGEVDLSTFPLFALFAPALGMSAVIPVMDFTRPAKANPRHIINAIERYSVTSLFGSPALLRRLGLWNREHQHRLPTLRRILSAGAPVPAAVLSDIVPMLGAGVQIHTPYGATEILPVASMASDEILAETAAQTALGKGVCVGRPVQDVMLKIIKISTHPVSSDRVQTLKVGEVGEIIAHGPNLSLGYDNREPAQKHARFTDPLGRAWHRMGDMGYLDERGRLWFCGRVAHRVQAMGKDFYPILCEGVFNAHPLVYRTALVALQTGAGSVPALCVELEKRASRSERERIRDELIQLGAKFKHTTDITDIFFNASFPVDIRHNAKIDREKLGRWASGHRR